MGACGEATVAAASQLSVITGGISYRFSFALRRLPKLLKVGAAVEALSMVLPPAGLACPLQCDDHG
jgi:hypothetical protein